MNKRDRLIAGSAVLVVAVVVVGILALLGVFRNCPKTFHVACRR
jgi:hypothetical protein